MLLSVLVVVGVMMMDVGGAAGVRALTVLKSLLVTGPISTLSYSLDLIPVILAISSLGDKPQQTAIQVDIPTQINDFVS